VRDDLAVTQPTDVVAGFFSFTEITDPDAHHGYNEWHQLDHLPEQMPIAGIAHGQRWVSSPRCKALSQSNGTGISDAHYLTLYMMRPPLDETLDDFYKLAVRLHEEDRFFPHRRALASGPLAVLGTHSVPRVRVSSAAVPFRPNRGVYVIVTSPAEPESESESASESAVRGRSAARLDALLGTPGVAGVWRFGPSTGQGAPARGGGKPLQADVTICYLDEDPVVVAGPIGEILSAGSEREPITPTFAGPFETIIPWSWDWFDDKSFDGQSE
jgi:hypothetical protein